METVSKTNLDTQKDSSQLIKGIACLVISAFSFSLMAVLVHSAGDIPFVQKAFFRNIVALIISVIVILRKREKINIPKGSMK